MVDLYCAPFVDLIDRMRLEYPQQGRLFDLPSRKWYTPPQGAGAADLSVRFHGRPAGNPVGPASGPQTQMAQNLVLSWLAGARILELKTVQVEDQLEIPRPCIDAANVGYNVEFSQELALADSLDQYVQGAMLIHMLRHAPDVFGNPFGAADHRGSTGQTVYDMSIGYDLAGIQSAKVRRFIEGMIDAGEAIERLRRRLPARLRRLRDLDYPSQLSQSVTLSTFHGCPADEIERICRFLLVELNVDTIVKMNPPMLGREQLEHLLHDVMGYDDIRVHKSAYTSGLQFDESIDICQRLFALARAHGRHFGAKFSNTLEVRNHRDFFPATEKIMYLSGPPLHVITLALADRFRRAAGAEIPISFSAGVDRRNFPAMVACGFVPVTTCTDLLKTGGYGRLPPYLAALEQALRRAGAGTVDQYILAAAGGRAEAAADVLEAGRINTSNAAAEARSDQRYRRENNSARPRRIDSHLVLFDCITCDKCVPVCPNDANFLYDSPAVHVTYRDLQIATDSAVSECGPQRLFTLARQQQIANFADFCNQCGNCDTFCPEWDGPYLQKPNFFGSRRSFAAAAPHDGFLLEGQPGSFSLRARLQGQMLQLDQLGAGPNYRFSDGQVAILVQPQQAVRLDGVSPAVELPYRVDMSRFHTMVTLLAGVTSPTRVHPVNIRLLAPDPLLSDKSPAGG